MEKERRSEGVSKHEAQRRKASKEQFMPHIAPHFRLFWCVLLLGMQMDFLACLRLPLFFSGALQGFLPYMPDIRNMGKKSHFFYQINV